MKRKTAILLSLILALSLLAACGSSGFDASMSAPSGDWGSASTPQAAPAASAAPDVSYNSLSIAESSRAGGAPDTDASSLSDAPDTQQAGAADVMAEKIIYTAFADIETVEFDETIEKIYDLLDFNRAFIENSYIGGRNYMQSYHGYQTYRTAHFTMRIPKDRFEAVTSGLDVLGNVTSLRTNAENITAQFVDTEARLTSFRIQEERLLSMLEKSETVADMISIESRLAEVRYSIESLTSTLKNWQSQVDYSTLTVYVYEVEVYTEYVPIQRTYWQQVGDGLKSRTRSVGEFFTNLFKWIIINLPVFAVLAVLAVVAVIVVKKKLRKRALFDRDETDDRD